MAAAQPKTNRRYVQRTVTELKVGDVFSLDDGKTYHECAENLAPTGTIAVAHHSGGTIRIPVEGPAQVCTVQVDYLRVRIAYTLEVDIASWDDLYDTGNHFDDVRADVKRYFNPDNLIPSYLDDIVKIAE